MEVWVAFGTGIFVGLMIGILSMGIMVLWKN
jgi:uncharacterized membrane-anchored protein YhcB (DUF1043 family)